jgi:lysophospholipase L1-like esterase
MTRATAAPIPRSGKRLDAACAKATAPVYGRNLEAILKSIKVLRTGKPTILRVTNDYNDMIGEPTVPKFFYAASKPFYDVYSALTCRLARKHEAVCIDTYHAFNGPNGRRDAGSLLADDHTHPSAKGHRLIAQLLERAGYQPLFR